MLDVLVVFVLCCVGVIALSCIYGLKAYFAFKSKELEVQHPANKGVSLAEFEELVRQVEDIDKKLAPIITMRANRQIFAGR